MPAIFGAGYNLNFFDDDSFKQIGRVENGSLVLGQNKYKIVILPGVESIPLDTYQKFEEFARGGGILIATKRTPNQIPGFLATQQTQNQIAELSKRLFDAPSSPAHLVLDEKTQLGPVMNKLLRPDVYLSLAFPELGFIHRTTDDAEIYFVANTGNLPLSVTANIRAPGMKAEEWNPLTGTVKEAKDESTQREYSVLPINLGPYESRVFVFTKRMWPYRESTSVKIPAPIDLSNDWQVTVGASAVTTWPKLQSWTQDEATRYFSGVASYTKEVAIPSQMIQQGLSVRLYLGEGIPLTAQNLRNGMQAWLDGPIREAAVVYVNDRRAGAVWCPPYSLDITEFVKPGANKIRIEVANTAMNYMAGHSLPDYRLLNLRYGERFQPQDMDKIQALPSGLLGPVRLIASAK